MIYFEGEEYLPGTYCPIGFFHGWRHLKYQNPFMACCTDEDFALVFWLLWFLAWRNALEYRLWIGTIKRLEQPTQEWKDKYLYGRWKDGPL